VRSTFRFCFPIEFFSRGLEALKGKKLKKPDLFSSLSLSHLSSLSPLSFFTNSSTFKLKFGHHGGNHPIRHKPSGRVEISAQNHNFAVDPASLPANVEVTHINLNDGTCAGLVVKDKAALSIQYHPEASPGPHDADVCFEMFVDEMVKARAAKKDAVAA
jgi:hypothetical protein